MALVRLPILLSSVVLLLTAWGRAAAQDDETAALSLLEREADAGLPALVARVKAEKIPPPQIYSEWYVNESGRAPADRLEIERRKRQWGRRLLECLERTSEEILAMKDRRSREQIALALFDLGDWIAQAPGYGNAVILSRCQDMATVPLAHLAADLSYPESRLDTLASRLRSSAHMYRVAADALESEAPGSSFAAEKNLAPEATQRFIATAWSNGYKRAGEWLKSNRGKFVMPKGRELRKTLPEDLRFYCDDERPALSTTLELWDFKLHRRLILGLGGVNARNIENFLLFRKKVGRFPTDPPSWWKPNDGALDTPTKAAFEQAWEPYSREFGAIYWVAALIYDATRDNTFYDHDTQLKRAPVGRSPSSSPAGG